MTNNERFLITGVKAIRAWAAVVQALQGGRVPLRGSGRRKPTESGPRRGAMGSTLSRVILTTRRRCAVHWPARGALRRAKRGEAGVARERGAGQASGDTGPQAGVEHYLHIRGSAHKRTGHPALRQEVAHRGGRAQPPLPSHVSCPRFVMGET